MSLRRSALTMLALGLLMVGYSSRLQAADKPAKVQQIVVPGEDRFKPFAVTVQEGQKVEWVNKDNEIHYLVSNDAFNTAGHKGVNMVIPAGGKVTLVFKHAGSFPFYCSLHSMLDADHQPKAPGPEGGIQDSNGNYGTPMNGVVTVVAKTKN